jgi:putative phosphoesterase
MTIHFAQQARRSAVRVAAIYDIHGNLPALEAVLHEIQKAGVDQIVVGGDVVPGPMPRETLTCLLNLEIPVFFIRGNGDREVLAQMSGIETGSVPEQFREGLRWNAQQLHPSDKEVLASWPETFRTEIAGIGEVLFCHATPRNDTEIFTRLTPEVQLLPIFAEFNGHMIICGHTHMQFDRMIGTIRVINAGSVGMPFQEAGAYWPLLGPDIEFRHTYYDFNNAAERIRATKYPQAEDFAARNVLQPPSEKETLQAFAKVELR